MARVAAFRVTSNESFELSLSPSAVRYSSYRNGLGHAPAGFVLVVGDVDDVSENAEITILERLNTVVLGEATYEAVARLRGAPDVFIRIFHYEEDARRAFDLFAR